MLRLERLFHCCARYANGDLGAALANKVNNVDLIGDMSVLLTYLAGLASLDFSGLRL